MASVIMKKIVDEIIKDEFQKVLDEEIKFSNSSTEQRELSHITTNIYSELTKTLTDREKSLLMQYDDLIANIWYNLIEFYFNEGVNIGMELAELRNLNN